MKAKARVIDPVYLHNFGLQKGDIVEVVKDPLFNSIWDLPKSIGGFATTHKRYNAPYIRLIAGTLEA